MTREEEIIESAKRMYSPSSGIPQSLSMRVGFIEGAKWADEHPNLYHDKFIDKACEWLVHQEEMIGISFSDEFIERFKKDMEE